MARSTRVYVVRDPFLGDSIAGFTVKHELITWLTKSDHPRRDELIIESLPDGRNWGQLPIKTFTVQELIGE